jgi:hypothetical protein
MITHARWARQHPSGRQDTIPLLIAETIPLEPVKEATGEGVRRAVEIEMEGSGLHL